MHGLLTIGFALALTTTAYAEPNDWTGVVHDEELQESYEVRFFADHTPVWEMAHEISDSFVGSEPNDNEFDFGAEGLIGDNIHKRVNGHANYPFRTVGHMSNGCTGTLVGPKHVLTAAHCVYDRELGDWKKNIYFYPGRNDDDNGPYGRWKVRRKLATKGYIEDGRAEFDFALMILWDRDDVHAGDRVGWLGMGYDNNLSLSSKINIVGYPGHKPWGTMWRTFCPIKRLADQYIHHNCDTTPGNSGSAMYRKRGDERIIYGVHSYGYGESGDMLNSGPRINQQVFDLLKRWLDEN